MKDCGLFSTAINMHLYVPNRWLVSPMFIYFKLPAHLKVELTRSIELMLRTERLCDLSVQTSDYRTWFIY